MPPDVKENMSVHPHTIWPHRKLQIIEIWEKLGENELMEHPVTTENLLRALRSARNNFEHLDNIWIMDELQDDVK